MAVWGRSRRELRGGFKGGPPPSQLLSSPPIPTRSTMVSWSCSKCTYLNSPSHNSTNKICLFPSSNSTSSFAVGAGSPALGGGGRKWSCRACTFANPFDTRACEMCAKPATPFSNLDELGLDDDDVFDPSVQSVFWPLPRCSGGDKRGSDGDADGSHLEKAARKDETPAAGGRKRKWDQPAEALVSAGVVVPGPLQLGLYVTPGNSFPSGVTLHGALLTNPVSATSVRTQLPSAISHGAATAIQKLNYPKIQDEFIAREIVINNAEPTVRYKLTKRQTQEEILQVTGAVVITRGKYRPPNGLPDNEKPLYLHISAGSHLKDTAERIKAIDRAALMVEEILKQGQNSMPSSTLLNSVSSNGQVIQMLSTCVFLGFEPSPSLDIAARIRGPNGQYVNHIMNETGATVVLRGRGSGKYESSQDEETQPPLHLFMSSINVKSLENARILAENLMDTISAECCATRTSSSMVYNAVPPPKQLMADALSQPNILDANRNSTAALPSTLTGSLTSLPASAPHGTPYPGTTMQSTVFPGYAASQSNIVGYSYPSTTGGTCYNGYGGIYPQATPLQQVALALRQAPASTTFTSTSLPTSTVTNTSSNSTAETDKRPSQKRKFQELPATSMGPTLNQNLRQEEFLKPGSYDFSARNVSSMPPSKKLVSQGSVGALTQQPRNMPPPPPKLSMAMSSNAERKIPVVTKSPPSNMPPPPPRFMAPQQPPRAESRDPDVTRSNAELVPDTLLKLVEYGEEDDDIDVPGEESSETSPLANSSSKPFWAV